MHRILEAVHDINTFNVGLRAGSIALQKEQSDSSDKRLEQLAHMAKVVTSDIVERVEHHATTFIYARNTLDKTSPLYKRIQSRL